MSSLHWKKTLMNVLIIIATTIGILFALKAANVKPEKACLDAIDTMKIPGVLVKDYTVYKKWIN